MTPRSFGTLSSGEAVEAYRLTNAAGAFVEVLTYGAIITRLGVPDRRGHIADVVLGFDHLSPYLTNSAYIGALVGRVAGRVHGGHLSIEGRDYRLACNSGPHHLHGGHVGLDQRLWRAQPLTSADGAAALQLTCRSPAGEEGYPGTVDIIVTYILTSQNALIVDTEATVDAVTPVSLTQHAYFNLAGEGSGAITDHTLQIEADFAVPTDDEMKLSGLREPVSGRANDLTKPRLLRDIIPRLFKAHGDLYVLREHSAASVPPNERTLPCVARLTQADTGRSLAVFTDSACLQFYSGVSLDGSLTGKSGRAYGPHAGLCLECQGYPEATRHAGFADILVHPGRPQRRRTIYAFSNF